MGRKMMKRPPTMLSSKSKDSPQNTKRSHKSKGSSTGTQNKYSYKHFDSWTREVDRMKYEQNSDFSFSTLSDSEFESRVIQEDEKTQAKTGILDRQSRITL